MYIPELSPPALSLHIGLYKHFKGNTYRVLGVGLHSETFEEYVVYQAQYGQKLIYIRPLNMFLGTVQINGKTIQRFQHIES